MSIDAGPPEVGLAKSKVPKEGSRELKTPPVTGSVNGKEITEA